MSLQQTHLTQTTGGVNLPTHQSNMMQGTNTQGQMRSTNLLPMVLVAGATGKQGGSVVDWLLRDGNYRVRAITRDMKSECAKKLQDRGCELVQADLCKSESILNALDGCAAFFLLTDFYEAKTAENEIKQGKCALNAWQQACKKGTSIHLLFSSLPSTKLTANLDVPHFDGKWETVKYLRSLGLSNYTVVCPFFYMQNFETMMKPKELEDGTYQLVLPMGGRNLPLIDISTLGAYVLNILKKGQQLYGKYVMCFGDYNNATQICEAMSARYQVRMKALDPKDEECKSLGINEEFLNMFKWFQWLCHQKGMRMGNPYGNIISDKDYVLGSQLFADRTLQQWLELGGMKDLLIQRSTVRVDGPYGTKLMQEQQYLQQHKLQQPVGGDNLMEKQTLSQGQVRNMPSMDPSLQQNRPF